MFIAAPDKKELRQGDILAGVWFPRIRFEDIRLVAHVDHSDQEKIVAVPELVTDREMEWTTAQIQMTRRFVMVLSQCCDMVISGGNTRAQTLVVAPLVPVPDRYRRQIEFDALRANKIEEYVNLFYVEQRDPLPSDFVVDFRRVVSVVLRNALARFLDLKVLQLTDETRIVLKSKLAFSFGRLTEEEEAAGYKLATPSAAAPAAPPEDRAKQESEAVGAPAPAETGDKPEQKVPAGPGR